MSTNWKNSKATTKKKINKTFNFKTIYMLYYALSVNEYYRISLCKITKEIWDKLRVIHEDTTQAKDTKINLVTRDYELF